MKTGFLRGLTFKLSLKRKRPSERRPTTFLYFGKLWKFPFQFLHNNWRSFPKLLSHSQAGWTRALVSSSELGGLHALASARCFEGSGLRACAQEPLCLWGAMEGWSGSRLATLILPPCLPLHAAYWWQGYLNWLFLECLLRNAGTAVTKSVDTPNDFDGFST